MLPMNEIQRALYQALTAALAPVPIVDRAGPNQSFPYITIGELYGNETDTLGEQSQDFEFTAHVWSRQKGMAECQALMEKVKDALDRKRFPAATFQWVSTIWEFAQTLRDPDGITSHGVVRFRVLVFQPSVMSK